MKDGLRAWRAACSTSHQRQDTVEAPCNLRNKLCGLASTIILFPVLQHVFVLACRQCDSIKSTNVI